MNRYRYLNHILIWNVFFCIVCLPTAGKLVDFFGVPLSIATYYFPFIYLFSDITTEVYGYVMARHILWYLIAAQALATLIFQFVVLYPPSAVMSDNAAFVHVLSAAPRLAFFGTIAVFVGDVVNNYVLAKMKVWTGGKYIAARFVLSTVCGQIVNTGFFFTFGLWGILPERALLQSIWVGSALKVAVEIVLLPVTLRVAAWLKKAEKVDFYDDKTDFNPLKF